MKWIRRVVKITIFVSFCMNPASGDPMKWIRRVVKITIFASFCMNPAMGDPMKRIRRVIKITFFASFCMNPASGDPVARFGQGPLIEIKIKKKTAIFPASRPGKVFTIFRGRIAEAKTALA